MRRMLAFLSVILSLPAPALAQGAKTSDMAGTAQDSEEVRAVREAAIALKVAHPKLAGRLTQLANAEAAKDPKRRTEGSHGNEEALSVLREAAARLNGSRPKLARQLKQIVLKAELGE